MKRSILISFLLASVLAFSNGEESLTSEVSVVFYSDTSLNDVSPYWNIADNLYKALSQINNISSNLEIIGNLIKDISAAGLKVLNEFMKSILEANEKSKASILEADEVSAESTKKSYATPTISIAIQEEVVESKDKDKKNMEYACSQLKNNLEETMLNSHQGSLDIRQLPLHIRELAKECKINLHKYQFAEIFSEMNEFIGKLQLL